MPRACSSPISTMSCPPELIAQHPAPRARREPPAAPGRRERRAARTSRSPTCPALVDARDALVLNDTRVIKARLAGAQERRGGRVELFVERITGEREALALIAREPSARGRARGSRSATASRSRCSAARRTCSACASPSRRRTRCSSATAACRCRPTSRHAPDARGRRALPDRLRRAARRGGRAHRRACISIEAMLDEIADKRREHRHSHAARRRRHLPAGARREHRGAPHAQRALRRSRARRIATRAPGRRVLAVGTTTLRALESAALTRAAARARPTSSSTPASSSGWSTACSPTSICRIDPADAGRRLRRPGEHPQRLRACDRAALPLLHLRRRDADRESRYEVHASRHRDGAARRGALDARARRGRHAGLHAGGHLRHGEGDDARGAGRSSARRSCSATPSTSGCGPGSR